MHCADVKATRILELSVFMAGHLYVLGPLYRNAAVWKSVVSCWKATHCAEWKLALPGIHQWALAQFIVKENALNYKSVDGADVSCSFT